MSDKRMNVFEQAISTIRQFRDANLGANWQGAFLLTSWTAEGTVAAMADYPVVYSGTPRYVTIPQDSRVKVVNASNVVVTGAKFAYYDQITSGIRSFSNLHSGARTTPNVVMGIAIAPKATFDDMVLPAKRRHLPIMRVNLDEAEGNTTSEPSSSFSAAEVTILSTWFNGRGITNTVFSAYFGSTPAQISAWMQANPRWLFAEKIAEAWGKLA